MPPVDAAEEFVLGIAAGETNETTAAAWLRERIEPVPES